jgi:putative phosphoesterase
MPQIGLISDTHGLLRPQALDALAGCAHIIHAGDIGGPEILQALAAIAPVTAVRGNNDREEWARQLPDIATLEVEGASIAVIHDLNQWRMAQAPRVVVSGHSHKPACHTRDGILYINPGSAGPRRFKLPIAVARLTLDDGHIVPELIELRA